MSSSDSINDPIIKLRKLLGLPVESTSILPEDMELAFRDDVTADMFSLPVDVNNVDGSSKRPREDDVQKTRKSTRCRYRHDCTKILFPEDKDFKTYNVIGWQLAAAVLGDKRHSLDVHFAEVLGIMVKTKDEEFEEILKKRGKSLAQESIREFLVENGYPVEEKKFFYRSSLQRSVFGNDISVKLRSCLGESRLQHNQGFCKDVVSNLSKSIIQKHDGCLERLRVGMTKGKTPKCFFFMV